MRSDRLFAWLGVLLLLIGLSLALFPTDLPRNNVVSVLFWNGAVFILGGLVLLALSWSRARHVQKHHAPGQEAER